LACGLCQSAAPVTGVPASVPPSVDSSRPKPTLRLLLILAWPIVVSRATQVVVGMGDAVMVANQGEGALAATTAGALNFFALLILPVGVVFIVSSFSSQLFGKGDLQGARRYGFYGLAVAAATQLLSFGAMAVTGPVLAWFPYGADVHASMTDYLMFRLPSVGAAVGVEALANYYGGVGNTRLPMRANIFAMVIDVFGNYLLINGNLGAPAMGVRGAAITSTVSTVLAFAWLLRVFLREGRASGRVVPGLSLRELRRMLRYGLPSGFNWFFEFFAFNFFVNVVVAGLGTTALAALMAVFQMNSVAFMPAFALASAGSILVGQAIGAGAPDDVPRVVRLTFAAAGTWQGLVGLLYLFLPGLLFAAFARGAADTEALRETGTRMLMLSSAWQLFDAAATTVAEALRAAGDTAYVLWARLIIAWGVFVPGSYFTIRYLRWGDVGAVFWLVLYLGLLAAALFLRFKRGAWRHIQLTDTLAEV
jgi:multidrug resistance protein, MATE family